MNKRIVSTTFLFCYKDSKIKLQQAVDFFNTNFTQNTYKLFSKTDDEIEIMIKFNKKKEITASTKYMMFGIQPKIAKVKFERLTKDRLLTGKEVEEVNILLEPKEEIKFNIESDNEDKLQKKRKETSLKNKKYIDGNILELSKEGEISVLTISSILKARKHWENLIEDTIVKEEFTGKLKSNWNYINFQLDLTNKKRHLWLYSSIPDCGKTTFLKYIRNTFKSYDYVMEETYQSPSLTSEVITIDEFKRGMISRQKLCSICDGVHKFPQKNKDAVLPPIKLVIVCSNYPINYCFDKEAAFIDARFIEYCVEKKEFNTELANYTALIYSH